MEKIIIQSYQQNQRLVRFLGRYMPLAPQSFFYKMLRKKNITLNGKKAQGTEILTEGDIVDLFLSEETLAKMGAIKSEASPAPKTIERPPLSGLEEYQNAYQILKGIEVLWEDADLLVLFKPPGVLSQKDKSGHPSLAEWTVGYLLQTGHCTRESLRYFRPAPAHRLDRNTAGLVLAGKSLRASQLLSSWIRQGLLRKEYLALAWGKVEHQGEIRLALHKDKEANKSLIDQVGQPVRPGRFFDLAWSISNHSLDPAGAVSLCRPLSCQSIEISGNRLSISLVHLSLITGKSHQLRAHMAGIGHGICGDKKYAASGRERQGNDLLERQFSLTHQALFAYKICFPKQDTYGEEWAEAWYGRVFCHRHYPLMEEIYGSLDV